MITSLLYGKIIDKALESTYLCDIVIGGIAYVISVLLDIILLPVELIISIIIKVIDKIKENKTCK